MSDQPPISRPTAPPSAPPLPPWAQPAAPASPAAAKPAPPSWAWESPDSPQSQPPQPEQSDAPDRPRPPAPRSWRPLVNFILGAVLGGLFVGIVLRPAPGSSGPATATATPVPPTAIVYTVTRVSGASLVAVPQDNTPIIIHTGASTTYQLDGMPARFSDIKIGARVTIRGAFGKDGSITAGKVAILDPAISGSIEGLSGHTVLVTQHGRASITVVLNVSTKILDSNLRQPVSGSVLKVGKTVQVFGNLAPSGAFEAVVVYVQV